MTREMAQQEQCLIPEMRFHETMLGVGVMLNVLNGMKDFHCHHGKNDNETMLFSFAQKEKPVVIRTKNYHDMKAMAIVMPLKNISREGIE